MTDAIAAAFRQLSCDADFWSLRFTDERAESFAVRKNVAQPPALLVDRGAMLTVYAGRGCGYAATCDLSPAALQAALDRAAGWARAGAKRSLIDFGALARPAPRGTYASPDTATPGWSQRAWYDLLADESRQAGSDPRIVDWEATVETRTAEHRYLTSAGGDVTQHYRFVMPGMSVTAHADGDTQTRTLNGYRGLAQQGGEAMLDRFAFVGSGRRIADEVLQLLLAPNCPHGSMDVLLLPDQMVLQIHESIGHPLELDRILGDERNFAGTSFVTLDMFGTYRYGSELLNVCFDPTPPEELASYAFDDDGTPAEKAYLIRNGILERPLGGAISQARAGMHGVANSRADNWNRPPIDRMANINLEPGEATLEDMIAGLERGVLMSTNSSWSIDDSRNKFQFGCEWGQLIEDGRLTRVVKNPNYRGISANFWRSLTRVGNAATMQVLGTPYCGKGEPSQVIRVGHASPACVFTAVDVFGGDTA
ncbi:MAG TPA: TldD/PmbA family protein [Casimicrobiaceae bacterium]|jgi:predicted Zn-dependent protease|nr:TldD/PmbA family protein [Casimicrobiaceae bacterium]